MKKLLTLISIIFFSSCDNIHYSTGSDGHYICCGEGIDEDDLPDYDLDHLEDWIDTTDDWIDTTEGLIDTTEGW